MARHRTLTTSPRTTVVLAAMIAGAAMVLAPTPAAAQSACGAGYTVDTGDSLLEIATRCGVTLPALLAANPGVRDRMDLEVGDRLRIPAPGDPQPSPLEACGAYYTVRTGDTLAEIAEKCGLTVPLLVAANGPLPDPLGIHDGMRIRIPDLPDRAVRDTATLAFPPAAATAAQGAGAEMEAGAETQVEAAAEAEAEAEAEMEAESAAEAEAEGEAEAEADPEAEAAADEAAAEEAVEAEGDAPAEEMIRLEGVLAPGERCLLVRSGERGDFALVGRLTDAFAPGDRVVVMGVPAEADACAHSPALEVRILYRDTGPGR